jgi:hypothetical protein
MLPCEQTQEELAQRSFQNAGLNDEQIAELRRAEGVTAERLPELAGADLRKRLRNDVRILCLSANQRHPLQWAHYANGHQGVCVHFRSDAGTWVGGARKVKYRPDRLFGFHWIFKRMTNLRIG